MRSFPLQIVTADGMIFDGQAESISVRAAGGDIVYRDYLQLSLTMNHMVIDGAPGAKFLQTLKDIIENFELVCIAG